MPAAQQWVGQKNGGWRSWLVSCLPASSQLWDDLGQVVGLRWHACRATDNIGVKLETGAKDKHHLMRGGVWAMRVHAAKLEFALQRAVGHENWVLYVTASPDQLQARTLMAPTTLGTHVGAELVCSMP